MRRKIDWRDALYEAVFWVVVFVILLGMWLSLPARAADSYTARNGDDWVRVTSKPCRLSAVLAKTPEGTRAYYRAGQSHIAGKDYETCWVLLRSDDVFVAYEDGDAGLIPWDDFKADDSKEL